MHVVSCNIVTLDSCLGSRNNVWFDHRFGSRGLTTLESRVGSLFCLQFAASEIYVTLSRVRLTLNSRLDTRNIVT